MLSGSLGFSGSGSGSAIINGDIGLDGALYGATLCFLISLGLSLCGGVGVGVREISKTGVIDLDGFLCCICTLSLANLSLSRYFLYTADALSLSTVQSYVSPVHTSKINLYILSVWGN